MRSYAAGLEAYRQQRWAEALGFFKESLVLWPAHGPSRTMAERCQLYQKAFPPEEWDGVFEALYKYSVHFPSVKARWQTIARSATP